MTKKEMSQREFAMMGNRARNKKLTPERRKEIALNAVRARWRKVKALKKL